jgi:hypothetical protein
MSNAAFFCFAIIYPSTRNNVSVLVKALSYKPEGRGFETRRGECIFSIYLILPAELASGVYLAFNRNEYQNRTINVFGE